MHLHLDCLFRRDHINEQSIIRIRATLAYTRTHNAQWEGKKRWPYIRTAHSMHTAFFSSFKSIFQCWVTVCTVNGSLNMHCSLAMRGFDSLSDQCFSDSHTRQQFHCWLARSLPSLTQFRRADQFRILISFKLFTQIIFLLNEICTNNTTLLSCWAISWSSRMSTCHG